MYATLLVLQQNFIFKEKTNFIFAYRMVYSQSSTAYY